VSWSVLPWGTVFGCLKLLYVPSALRSEKSKADASMSSSSSLHYRQEEGSENNADELNTILEEIRLYDEAQREKSRRDAQRSSALKDDSATTQAEEQTRKMNPQDDDHHEGAPSLIEELIKFQRQHSILGSDDDIVSVVSTQLSTQTSSGSSEASSRSATGATIPSRTQPQQRPRRSSTVSPVPFGSRPRGHPRKEGVYRQPLSREVFLNKRDDEEKGMSVLTRRASFAHASSDARCSPRRASAPTISCSSRCPDCTTTTTEEEEVEQLRLLELLHQERVEILAADEALARRLQLELNAAASSPTDDVATSHHALFEPVRDDSAVVESTLEQKEQKDLEVALYISRQHHYAYGLGKDSCCCHEQLPSSSKGKREDVPQDDNVNGSFVTAANSSFQSSSNSDNDDDDDDCAELLVQKGLVETAHAVLSGNYKLVSCQGCHQQLQSPLDYTLVYCPGCGFVSPAGASTTRVRRHGSD
jgi:hypothetical protein